MDAVVVPRELAAGRNLLPLRRLSGLGLVRDVGRRRRGAVPPRVQVCRGRELVLLDDAVFAYAQPRPARVTVDDHFVAGLHLERQEAIATYDFEADRVGGRIDLRDRRLEVAGLGRIRARRVGEDEKSEQ